MFYKILTRLRESRKLTQKEVSEAIGISRSTYAQYEIGRRQPDYETLIKIADYFGESLDYLLDRKEMKKYLPNSLTDEKTEFVIRNLVKKYNIDLAEEGKRDKLETLVKLVFEDQKTKD